MTIKNKRIEVLSYIPTTLPHPNIRDLYAGDVITAMNLSAPREAWIQIAEDQWCALAYNSYQLLCKV